MGTVPEFLDLSLGSVRASRSMPASIVGLSAPSSVAVTEHATPPFLATANALAIPDTFRLHAINASSVIMVSLRDAVFHAARPRSTHATEKGYVSMMGRVNAAASAEDLSAISLVPTLILAVSRLDAAVTENVQGRRPHARALRMPPLASGC